MHICIFAILVYASNNHLNVEANTILSLNEMYRDWKNSRKIEEVAKRVEDDDDDEETIKKKEDTVVVECLYQYPSAEHMNALNSNIMNLLTKVFVYTRNYLLHRRAGGHPLRFQVVSGPINTPFFDQIFSNMSSEYSDYAKNLSVPISRSSQDPCEHQDELKVIWTELLDLSQDVLRKATHKFFDKFDKTDTKLIKKLKLFESKQVQRTRKRQLKLLCREFQ